jgi:uncharacterized repeat protein (TIGR01451 family)
MNTKMGSLLSWKLLAFAGILLTALHVSAQPSVTRAQALNQPPGASPVSANLVQKLISTSADGKELLVDVNQVKPGDKLQYELTYSNAGPLGIKGLLATLPIPAGTSYQPDTALPAPAAVSADGVQFAPPPLKRQVQRNGQTVEETVPPQEYKALRWSIADLPANGSVTVKARVEVNSTR